MDSSLSDLGFTPSTAPAQTPASVASPAVQPTSDLSDLGFSSKTVNTPAPTGNVQQENQSGPIPTFFPATGNETPTQAGLKAVGNIIPSAINFGVGAIEAPFKGLAALPKIPGEVSSLVKESGGILPALGNFVPEFLKGFIPQGTRQLASGDIQGASKSFTEDPFGQVAPYVLLGREALSKISPSAGTAFDAGVSKVASPVTEGGSSLGTFAGKVAGKTSETAGAVGRFTSGQMTGLDYDTIGKIIKNPNEFSSAKIGSVTREGLATEVKGALDTLEEDLSETGKEYGPIRNMGSTNPQLGLPLERPSIQPRLISDTEAVTQAKVPHMVNVDPNWLESTIEKTTGLKLGPDGSWERTAESQLQDTKDVRAIQNLYDNWQPEFQKGGLSTSGYLNFRKSLAKLAKFDRELTKSADLENLSGIIRGQFNTKFRGQIPGLEKLDTSFAEKVKDFNDLKKGIIDKQGNLLKTAPSAIANAYKKGRGEFLSRLEELSPGIGKKIELMKAYDDIEYAMSHKVGTYARASGKIMGTSGAVGLMFGGLPGAAAMAVVSGVFEAIMANPSVAVPLLRAYSFSKEITAGVMSSLASAIKSTNQLPNGSQASFGQLTPRLQSAAQTVGESLTKKRPLGLSLQDVNEFKPKVTPGLSPEDAAIEESTQRIASREYPSLKKQYLEKKGVQIKDGEGNTVSVTLNTDEWRDLLPGYKGTNAPAVHEASSALNNKLYSELLDTMKGKGNGKISVYAGGGGSGKGTAVIGMDPASIVLDQVSGNYDKLITKLKEAESKGFQSDYVFVDRSPYEAFVNGVVRRALNLRDNNKIARTVPLDVSVSDNIAARDVALRVLKENPEIPASIIDNTRELPRMITDRAKAIEYLEKKMYNKEQVRNKIYEHIQGLYKQGKIPSDLARGFIGQTAE